MAHDGRGWTPSSSTSAGTAWTCTFRPLGHHFVVDNDQAGLAELATRLEAHPQSS